VELLELIVVDEVAWRTWLLDHHADSPGVWLVLAKKGTTDPTTLSYDEALAEALCFGWVDGQLGRRDEVTFRRRFTPRRAQSKWSQRNVALAEALIASGHMQQAGHAQIQRAKDDGRWDAAYASQANAQVPDDLAIALAGHPSAQSLFAQLTSANRYAILYRLANAKKADTRATRINDIVAMLDRGETFHPQ
jgi:uncharacterized protein YdeI (YjbR/CyaY-like superfamily)